MIRRLVAVAALGLLGLAGAATSQGAPVPAAPPAAEGAALALDLSAFGPSVLMTGGQLTATAMVSNPTTVSMTGLTVSLAATTDPITTRTALARFIEDPSTVATQAAVTVPLASSGIATNGPTNELAPGTTTSVPLSASPTALGMPTGTTGVYGIVVTVAGSTGVLATRTAAVTFYDAPLPTLRVALVATASGSQERVAQVASAASVPGATLALDPVAITDPTQAAALAANRELLALPSGDVDLTSLAHAGNELLIDFAVTDAATNTQPELAGLPWLAILPVVDSPTVALAAAKGATAGLLAAGTTLGTGTPVVDVAADGATLPVLVPDAGLSRILATYRPGQADAAARLVAESALVAQAGGGTPVVVAPGDGWQLVGPGVSQSASELLSAPWVQPLSVASLLAGQARADLVAPASRGSGEDLPADQIANLDRRLGDVADLAQTAAEPDSIYLPAGRTLLAPLALDLRGDVDARTSVYATATQSVDTTLNSLSVAAGSNVNLIAASGQVPITLHNDLDVDATVTVVMKSASPNLVVQDQPVVTIPAGGDVVARVAVSGVKSADVTTTVALENASGDVVAAPQVLRVRVRADWGNAVTAVFTVAIVILLVAGLVRTIRRGRRSSRMAPTKEETEVSDG